MTKNYRVCLILFAQFLMMELSLMKISGRSHSGAWRTQAFFSDLPGTVETASTSSSRISSGNTGLKHWKVDIYTTRSPKMFLPTAPLGTNGLQLGLMTWHCLALGICTYCTQTTCSRFADMSYDLSSSSFSEILEGHVGPVASELRCGTKCRIDIDLASVRAQKHG